MGLEVVHTIWFKQIKSFSKFFNFLLIDFGGMGKSKNHMLDLANSTYTFDAIADEIFEVLDHENMHLPILWGFP